MAFQWIGKSEDGETITLRKLKESDFRFPRYPTPEWEAQNADLIRTGVILDVETSGLRIDQSKIIEIGIRSFQFNRETGEVLSLIDSYSSFQDPGEPLSAEVKAITGITDEMIKDHKIDWSRVDSILDSAQIIVAHNAAFDRPFVDSLSGVSRQKIWGCSFKQIDWSKKGFPSQKLDLLSIFHGFFTDAHRALNDVDALLHLLSHTDSTRGSPYLLELLTEARRTTYQLMALSAPFESKDLLKSRGYRWDNPGKTWWKEIPQTELSLETEWLEEYVYSGAFRGKVIEIPPTEHFKGKTAP
ncbi:MAG: DNA polymerase III subunit epsilon [Bdellovibrionales bacterium]|nr:DNA polymerase III subunit epsilon [Bdellovibrionales bacterium]